ncbi:hypothetical protein ACIRSU_02925 [Streptomyces sp. NPDC101160]|uniref:hypothetical protein n=1 Tax=Streptomyces sp. NPDC101160 TaxID=3366118 RepID=UPI00382FF3EA
MAKTRTADVLAAGRGGMNGNLYAYRVRGLGRGGVVLWNSGGDDEPDRVVALPGADRCRVPVFVTVRQARVYVSRQGGWLATSETNTLDLTRVQQWLENPAGRPAPSGAVLESWNFFEDLARGLDEAHRLPRQSAVHNSAYEKLFGDACTAWTPVERRAVLELATAGMELWNSCPVILKPRSSIAFDSGRGVSRGQ